jgi:hypothetical protein
VELCTDVPPPGGNKNVEAGMIQEAHGKPRGLSEFLKDTTKLAHIDQISNAVFSINQIGFGGINATHGGLREGNPKN